MPNTLNEIRKKIDSVDSKILRLLQKRFKLALMTSKFKKSIKDAEREKIILKRLKEKSKGYGLLSIGFVEKIFTSIITESRKKQSKK